LSAEPKSEEQFLDWLRNDNGYTLAVATQDGRWVGILRLMFHWTMHVGEMYNYVGHEKRYCYATFGLAADALTEWMVRDFEGEPNLWHKAPHDGRIRPDGDPKKEYLDY